MPDLQGRTAREAEIQRAVNPLFAKQAREVRAAAIERREPGWEEFTLGLALALSPTLAGVYEVAGTNLAGKLGVEPGTIRNGLRAGSTEWARAKALEVAQGVTDVSKEKVDQAADAVAGGVEDRRKRRDREGLPLSQDEAAVIGAGLLAMKLETVFGPARSEMIAATEVTGAVTAGENDTTSVVAAGLGIAAAIGAGLAGAAMVRAGINAAERMVGQKIGKTLEKYRDDSLASLGKKLKDLKLADRVPVKIWVTEADARVCPICEPLHRKPQNEWPQILLRNGFPEVVRHVLRNGGPSAHPRCRCWTETVLVRRSQAA